ncbi:MAG: DUF2236 domain-containing protein [Roseivirga sp.]|nr:DUF2236 domain-containing protein [Roseivirga sp.]
MTEISYTNELLDHSRNIQDDLGDQVIAFYFPDRKNELEKLLVAVSDNRYEPTESAADSFRNLWQHVFRNTDLADRELQKKGQEFFAKNSSDLMLLLGFLSLPYCYAAANGAEVLIRSKLIKEEPEKRLLETAEFVLDVMAPNAFGANGKGLASILKVRLMHATIRYYVAQDKSWSDTFGRPINQEDLAGTNLSFSLIPMRGLRNMARHMSGEESLAYIRYWSLVGKLLGLREELLPESMKAANVLERKIRKRQFRKSEAGINLTNALMSYFDQATRGTELEGKGRAFSHFLLGETVANLLGLEVDVLKQRLFRPIPKFIKLRNVFLNKPDTYVSSLKRFSQQKEGKEGEEAFGLPRAFSSASDAP